MDSKIIMSLALVVFAAGKIAAQTKPTVKVKAAAATEKMDAATKSPEAQKTEATDKVSSETNKAKEAAMGIEFLAWGGYSFTVKNSDQSGSGSSSLTNYLGPAGGLHAYYDLGKILPVGTLDVGLSGGYTTYSKTNDITVALIPIDARARIVLADKFFGGNFFAGVLAGYNVYTASGVTVGTKPNFIDAGVYLGYSYKIFDELSISILSDFKYLISTDSSVAAGNLVITPGIGINYKF